MNRDQWDQAKQIFNAALELKPEERAGYLDNACTGIVGLRSEVEKLLASYRSEFMEERPGLGQQNEWGRYVKGASLGRYEVVRLVGAGGMGEVYLAKDKELGRKVAIKVLNTKYENTESNIQRFIQEAKAASALNHPNILTIHEIGHAENSHYIVSEFIDGRTLRTTLQTARLPLSRVLDITIQVAGALSAAHSAHIIHRDIKPENIILRDDGYVKVLDFGLAKVMPSFGGLDDETIKKNQTSKGLILGTVKYMSPEQARAAKIDERTDIFSLGVVLYEMITGQLPFAGDSTADVFANLVQKDPEPLSHFVTTFPDELQRIVSKLLRKDPDERYQTMRGLISDLSELKKQIAVAGDAPTLELNRDSTQKIELEGIKIPWYRRRLGFVTIPILLLGVLAFASYWRQYSAPPSEIRSLAVLPLKNLSGDPTQEYFADGMTEALISNLSQIEGLKVISRTSIMRYKDSREPLPDIAKVLGVDAVIEGSVMKAGDRVRVTAQLIHGASDTHMWARNYERDLSDILRLQSDVAQAIAREIQVKLTPAEQDRLASSGRIDPKAHEAYLLGKFHLSKNSEEDMSRSISYFQKAIEIEPNYADAHAGLAAAWLDRGIWGESSLSDFESNVRDAATTAIGIDPGNANAHIAMSQLLKNYDYNWTGAEEEAKKALEIDPNSTAALEVYSWLLQSLGRHAEVRPLMERAELLDPVSSQIQSSFGRMLYRARRYDEAETHLKRSIELDPTNYANYGRLGDVYIEMGRFDEAIAQFEKSSSIQPEGAHALRRAVVYARMGNRKKALDTMAGISNRPAWEIARLHTALGEVNEAFEALNSAAQRRDTLLVHVKEDPSFVSLQSDARWKALLRQLRFPEE